MQRLPAAADVQLITNPWLQVSFDEGTVMAAKIRYIGISILLPVLLCINALYFQNSYFYFIKKVYSRFSAWLHL